MAVGIEAWSDAELINSAKLGNADAFTVLYDRYVDRVYRLVAYRVGRTPDAEDLTQQTFVSAWQALDRYEITEVPFVAWLLKIAHNAAVSHLRSVRYSVELNEAISRAQEGADPADNVLHGEGWQAVLRALERLEPEQHQLVWMRYFEDLSYADIARLMGRSEANVRVMLHRSLKKLRKHLGGQA